MNAQTKQALKDQLADVTMDEALLILKLSLASSFDDATEEEKITISKALQKLSHLGVIVKMMESDIIDAMDRLELTNNSDDTVLESN